MYKYARSIFIAFTIATSSATAYVADGHEYALRCTKDGYVLTSKYPVKRTIGSGTGTRYVSGREKLHLGRNCDAFTKLNGYGSWCWANGGFFATFGEWRYEFWRQELHCEPERDYELNCRC
jgi:hypothetical protein